MTIMLKRKLNISQIISLFMLFAGVSLIQIENMNSVSNNDEKNEVLGLMCVVLASFLSGFAGVYFEKILKNSNVSIWFTLLSIIYFLAPSSIIL
jgi:UDP-sugar transporter A1/2/3